MKFMGKRVKREQYGQPEVDAGRGCQEWMRCQIWMLGGGAKDGCCRRDQKWMLEPGLDAMREQGLRNLPKGDDYQGTDWSRRLYSLRDPYLESKLQKSNPRIASTSPIWHNPPARRNRIHYAKVTHCARILGSTQVEDRDPRQNTERRTVPEENGRLLRMRKFKKGRSSASKIG